MKKFLPIFAALLIALFAIACGGAEDTAKKEADKPAEIAAPAGYQTMTVANGGTISGTVTYAGAMPKKVQIQKTKDTAVCGKTTHYKEDMLVSGNKGLANVVVRIMNISKGKGMDSMGSEFVLDQNGCVFSPHISIIPLGAQCTILNSDGILHNIHTFSEKNRPINRAQPKFLKKVEVEFTEPEVIRVTCDAHGWMSAWIVVADHPYYAVTDEKGNFQLDGVPPGTYSVKFWHEKLGESTGKITVGSGEAASLDHTYPAG